MEKIQFLTIIMILFIISYLTIALFKFKYSNGVFDFVSLLFLSMGILQKNYYFLKIYPIINFFAIFDVISSILTKLQREGFIDLKSDRESLINLISFFFYPLCCYGVFQTYKELKGIEYDIQKKGNNGEFRYTEIGRGA